MINKKSINFNVLLSVYYKEKSSNIEEFYTSKDDIKLTREVPVTHDEIVKHQKTRSAFNHSYENYQEAKND